MAKLDFNIPFLKSDGSPEMKPKTDDMKLKPNAMTPGHLVPEPVLDENGFAVLETITVGSILRRLLNTVEEADLKLGFEEREKRGRLARKVGDNTQASLKNYSVEELKLIQDQAAKLGATELVVQVSDIINGTSGEKEAA